MIADASKANEQRRAVNHAMQRDFLGTPPLFKDAVAVFLLSEASDEPLLLRPQIWRDDSDAHMMLASGRAAFQGPQSPTGDRLSGILLVTEKALPGRTAPDLPDEGFRAVQGGAEPAVAQDAVEREERPKDTTALRHRAKGWLLSYVNAGNHKTRDETIKEMVSQHPGLGVRGSKAVWKKVSEENPELRLSVSGPKSNSEHQ